MSRCRRLIQDVIRALVVCILVSAMFMERSSVYRVPFMYIVIQKRPAWLT